MHQGSNYAALGRARSKTESQAPVLRGLGRPVAPAAEAIVPAAPAALARPLMQKPLARPTDSPSAATSTRASGFKAAIATSVSPQRAVVLLYSRLLSDLDDATLAINKSDLNTAHHALIHAQEIIEGLDLCLDRSVWDGAEGLGMIYEFVSGRLVEANMQKDRRIIAECRQLIEPLAEAWREAWQQISEDENSSTPAA